MSRRTQNGNSVARSYLAKEVAAQKDVVSGLTVKVERMDVTVASLLEAHHRERDTASRHRQELRREVHAARSEQQQVAMSVTQIVASITKLEKQMGEQNNTFQQMVGAGKLVGQVGKLGWAIVGAIAAIILTLGGWIASHWR